MTGFLANPEPPIPRPEFPTANTGQTADTTPGSVGTWHATQSGDDVLRPPSFFFASTVVAPGNRRQHRAHC